VVAFARITARRLCVAVVVLVVAVVVVAVKVFVVLPGMLWTSARARGRVAIVVLVVRVGVGMLTAVALLAVMIQKMWPEVTLVRIITVRLFAATIVFVVAVVVSGVVGMPEVL
jgi:hypothetical protein